MDLVLVINAGLVDAIGKHRAQPHHRLALPCAHLVWMHLVPPRNLLDRFIAPQRFKRHLCLEIPLNCRRIVIAVFLR